MPPARLARGWGWAPVGRAADSWPVGWAVWCGWAPAGKSGGGWPLGRPWASVGGLRGGLGWAGRWLACAVRRLGCPWSWPAGGAAGGDGLGWLARGTAPAARPRRRFLALVYRAAGHAGRNAHDHGYHCPSLARSGRLIRWSAACDVSQNLEFLALPAKMQLRWVYGL